MPWLGLNSMTSLLRRDDAKENNEGGDKSEEIQDPQDDGRGQEYSLSTTKSE